MADKTLRDIYLAQIARQAMVGWKCCGRHDGEGHSHELGRLIPRDTAATLLEDIATLENCENGLYASGTASDPLAFH
jgi:hypothetical protein